jgi:nucleotide-binding universal stress UspA family protein
MFRDILVHVTGESSARLSYAIAFGRALGARVSAIHVMAPLEVRPLVRASQIGGVELALSEEARRSAAAAEALFQRGADRDDVETRWLAASGHIVDQVCRAARYADLVIVGHEGTEAAPERNPLSLADELVIRSGRPVLIVPDKASLPSPRQNIMVAWDGSREAVRAVHDALPLLKAPGAAVVVVTVSNHERLDDDVLKGDALVDHLARHGVASISVETLAMTGSDASGILRRLQQGDFDLLVMGGFRRSPLLEGFFGGATEDLIQSNRTPVFMSH